MPVHMQLKAWSQDWQNHHHVAASRVMNPVACWWMFNIWFTGGKVGWGEEELWLLAFADLNAVNAPTWLISSCLCDISECGIEKNVHSVLYWARASWLQCAIDGALSLPRFADQNLWDWSPRVWVLTSHLDYCDAHESLQSIMEVSSLLGFLQRWKCNQDIQIGSFGEATNYVR